MTAVAHPAGAPAAAVPWWRRPFALVMAAALLLNLPPLAYPLGWDQATYGYYAQEILRGAVPYRDFWEINAPVNFLLYVPVVAALGASPLAVNLLGLAEALASTALLYHLAQRWLSTRHAVVAALLYTATTALGFDYWGREEPEAFLGLATLAALAAVQHGDDHLGRRLPAWAVAGVLAGLAVLFKPTGGGTLAVLAAYRLLLAPSTDRRQLLGEAAALMAGLLAPVALVGGYLAAAGALPSLMQQVTEYNLRYAQNSFTLNLHWLLTRVLARFLLEVGPVPLLAAWAAVRLGHLQLPRPVTRFVLAWTVLAVATLAAQAFRHHYHYYNVIAPAALLAAMGLVSLDWGHIARSGVRGAALVAGVAAVYAALFYNANPGRVDGYLLAGPASAGLVALPRYAALFDWPGHWTAGRTVLVDYLVCHTQREASVYVTGEPAAYFLAGVRAPTRYYHEVPLAFSADPDALLQRYRDDLYARPPNFVAFYDSPLDEYVPQREGIQRMLAPLLAQQYTRAFQQDAVTVYRHASLPDARSSRCPA